MKLKSRTQKSRELQTLTNLFKTVINQKKRLETRTHWEGSSNCRHLWIIISANQVNMTAGNQENITDQRTKQQNPFENETKMIFSESCLIIGNYSWLKGTKITHSPEWNLSKPENQIFIFVLSANRELISGKSHETEHSGWPDVVLEIHHPSDVKLSMHLLLLNTWMRCEPEWGDSIDCI